MAERTENREQRLESQVQRPFCLNIFICTTSHTKMCFPILQKPDAGSSKALRSLTHPTSKGLGFFFAVAYGMNKAKTSRTNNRARDLPITRLLVPDRLVGDEERLALFPGVKKHSFTQ